VIIAAEVGQCDAMRPTDRFDALPEKADVERTKAQVMR
jgi:hypothetical protein